MLAQTELHIDGSSGEGGGQILRTSLSLSLVTGRPFRLHDIRANRETPGLRPQHLRAVTAAAELGQSRVLGAEVGSRELYFAPQLFGEALPAGRYRFDIGTAGSTSLVLQTVLPPLLRARGPSQVTVLGGTYNTKAPPFDFLDRVFAPILSRLGIGLSLRMQQPGFYPQGGGHILADITPPPATTVLPRLDLLQRGPLNQRRATVVLSRLPEQVATRELEVLRRLGWPPDCFSVRPLSRSRSPGNIVLIELASEHITELVSSVGERGVPAEQVAESALQEALTYLRADVPVGEHLADQLLLPLALGQGGRFRTLSPSLHTRTQAEIIRRFLPHVDIALVDETPHVTRIEVTAGDPS
jgi:RNA 3'-terminal phosphate cyclase (ATP)